MSELRIHHGEFPNAVPSDAVVGDSITLLVTGRIFAIEEDLIDASRLGGPRSYVPGERTTKIMVTDWEHKA